MPVVVCVCMTQCACSIAPWIALWITKPARFTGHFDSRTGLPSTSISTRLEARDLAVVQAERIDEEHASRGPARAA